MKGKGFYIITSVLFAVFSIVNVSGYGQAIESNKLLVYVLLLVSAFILVFVQKKKEKILSVYDSCFIIIIVLFYEASSYFQGFGGSGIGFLSFFICVYLFSMLEQSEFNLFLCSIIYLGFGFGILIIMCFTDMLSGWNPNSISIISLQSFLIFFATFKRENIFQVLLYAFAILAFAYFLWSMNCRSAMLCVITAALADLLTYHKAKWLKNKPILFILIIMPFIIAIITVFFSNSSIFESLNEWTIQNFGKDIFNGREKIWARGLEKTLQSPIFGHGEIYSGYWHNSAIACMFSYGIIGYMLYAISFAKLIFSGVDYMYDSIVRRSTVAFLILNLQQSFENSIFVIGGIFLPFVLLGILMGRINYLRKEHNLEQFSKYNHSNI